MPDDVRPLPPPAIEMEFTVLIEDRALYERLVYGRARSEPAPLTWAERCALAALALVTVAWCALLCWAAVLLLGGRA